MQIFIIIDKILKKSNIPIYIQTYNIIMTSISSGMIDFIEDAISLDWLKKWFPNTSWNLNTFYRRYFYDNFEEAQKNFV